MRLAPKARDSVAQSNALGIDESKTNQALKGRHKHRCANPHLALSGLGPIGLPIPRALPWLRYRGLSGLRTLDAKHIPRGEEENRRAKAGHHLVCTMAKARTLKFPLPLGDPSTGSGP